MIKFIDPHTILTIVIVVGLCVLSALKVEIPPLLVAVLAAVSPGLVAKKPEA